MPKKQSLYDKIRTVVEAGYIAITIDKGEEYTLWSSMTKDGQIRASWGDEDLTRCYEALWRFCLSKKEVARMVKEDWERYIWIYERPLRRPKEWDKVQVLEKYEKVFSWFIRTVVSNWSYCGVTLWNGDIMQIPYDCIAPRVEPDIE